MQSEGGAAGAVHGALQSRRADDDFHGIAGAAADAAQHVQDRRRVDATVFHVAARALATQALSIFGDHSDVMAARIDRLCHAVVGVGAGSARSRR